MEVIGEETRKRKSASTELTEITKQAKKRDYEKTKNDTFGGVRHNVTLRVFQCK